MPRRRGFMIVTGVDELDANLQALSGAAATRASKSALRAGLKVLEKAERAAAPRGATGATAASIGSRLISGNKVGILAKAGVNVGKKRGGIIINSAAPRNTTRRLARIAAGLTTAGRGAKARAQAASAPHAHLVALGTGPRFTKAAGISLKIKNRVRLLIGKKAGGRGYRGKMPANPFIRRAFESAVNNVKFAIREALAKAIGREVNKFGKKTGGPAPVA